MIIVFKYIFLNEKQNNCHYLGKKNGAPFYSKSLGTKNALDITTGIAPSNPAL
jgi:hypothetical protein